MQKIDVRIRILLLIMVSLMALLLKSEKVMLICLCLAAAWTAIIGGIRKVFPYVVIYFAVGVLLYYLKDVKGLGNLPLLLVYIQRLLIPVMMALTITCVPTGQLIAALNKWKLPKGATLSLAVLFRFMPTIVWEYRAIRETQKFRGIGISFVNACVQLPKMVEYILVPMLIRTSKVADELTASAQIRGAKLKGNFTSYHVLKIRVLDWCILGAGMFLTMLLIIFDRSW